MLIKTRRYAALALTAFFISSCSNIDNSVTNAATVSSKDSTVSQTETETSALKSYYCLTFGYRNWLMKSDGETLTLSGEASMPTPAWSIALHQGATGDNETIELVMETIEPAGLSSSVISWVAFDTTVKATATANIAVSCAGDTVWNSLDS